MHVSDFSDPLIQLVAYSRIASDPTERADRRLHAAVVYVFLTLPRAQQLEMIQLFNERATPREPKLIGELTPRQIRRQANCEAHRQVRKRERQRRAEAKREKELLKAKAKAAAAMPDLVADRRSLRHERTCASLYGRLGHMQRHAAARREIFARYCPAELLR